MLARLVLASVIFAAGGAVAAVTAVDAGNAPLRGRDAWGGRRAHIGVVNPVGRPADDPDTLSLRGEWLFSPRTPSNWRNSSSASSWRGPEADPRRWANAQTVPVPACWESYGFAPGGMGLSWKCWWDSSPNGLNHQFEGNCFYLKKVTVPAAWKGKRIWFKVGAVNAAGWFWINDRQVALVQEYCRTPKYDVTDLVTPGQEAKVVAEVSNFSASRRGCFNIVNCWGGILRDIEFEATPSDAWIDDAWVRGDFDEKCAEVRVEIGWAKPCRVGALADANGDLLPIQHSSAGAPTRQKVRVEIEGEVVEQEIGQSRQVPQSADQAILKVPLRNFRPWSPEHPHLYWATIELLADGKVVQTRRERFGVRKYEARGKEFYLNGEPFFVRGAGLHHIVPVEGVLPADRERIRRDVKVIRAAGFNQVRFHTECRWPEFFEVADEEGLMVMPELPYYGDVMTGDFEFDPIGDAVALWETIRRHPSFVCYSGGNEGWYGPELSKRFYDFVKRTDPDRLVFGEDAAPNPKTNGPGLSDMVGGPRTIWPTGFYEPNRPYLCHEYLNVCVKFDARLDRKFTGVWAAPVTRETRTAWLAKFGLDARWGDRLQDAQHVHQAHWRRFGLEHARRDPTCDGYSFWSLQDVMCPQTNPYEGSMEDRYREWHRTMRGGVARDPFIASAGQAVFDPFFGTKAKGESPADVAEYNSPSCVLLDEEDEDPAVAAAWWKACRGNPSAMWVGGTNRVKTAGERFPVGIWFAHYEQAPLDDARLDWTVTADDGRTLLSGGKKLGTLALGPSRRIARETLTVPALEKATRVTLRATVSAAGFRQSNRWHFWFFPKRTSRAADAVAAAEPFRARLLSRYPGLRPIAEAAAAKAVIVARGSADEAAALERGQTVISLAKTEGAPNVALGRWWMGSQLGMVLEDSPLLSALPHQGVLNPLLFRIVKEGLELPLADIAPADYRIVGEGRDACYLYLAESPLPNGARKYTVAGLDVLADTPEGTAILDGVLAPILGN